MDTYKSAEDMPLLMSIDEVCTLLRVDRGTLHKWQRKGVEMPKPIKIGSGRGYTRFKKDEVLEWLDRLQGL
jgi:excisionase family DNA binding protein